MIRLHEQVGRATTLHGQEYLFFSGYSYLGVHLLPSFMALVEEGRRKYG
jgi:8-amino-7-oxononanoate synthase